MKTMLIAGFFVLAILVAGCVSTVSGGKRMGMPFVKDKIEARYERPLDQVYQAAKEVIQYNGTVVNEKILYGQTNALNDVAKTLEGKVKQRTVWVRMEQEIANPKITDVTVQTRTQGGGSDLELAAEIDKQIALKLVR